MISTAYVVMYSIKHQKNTTTYQEKMTTWSDHLILVAMDGTTWNSIKEEIIGMWEIVTDYQKLESENL